MSPPMSNSEPNTRVDKFARLNALRATIESLTRTIAEAMKDLAAQHDMQTELEELIEEFQGVNHWRERHSANANDISRLESGIDTKITLRDGY